MTTKIKAVVNEKSAFAIQLNFYDEDDNVVVPNAVNWWLVDLDGTIVNSRSNVSVVPSTTVIIATNDDDNALDTVTSINRIIHVEAPYDSATLGNDQRQNVEYQYTIRKLVKTPG